MDRYLIESPHNAEDCDMILQQIASAGYLHNFDWGCADGIHGGWAVIETDNPSHAAQIVPWSVRDRARIVKLVKYDQADLHHEHK